MPKLGNAAFVSQSEGKVYNVFQDKITIKISGEMTNGAYSISEDITPPGRGAPPHVHSREDEMFYVLEGDYEFRCGDRRFTGSRDALVHLPRDIPHAFKNTGTTAGKFLVLLVPGVMEKVFEELSLMPPGPPSLEKINQITIKYGVEFLPPEN
ncbi:MAG: cupin domain-containing protein [Candidatus Bathyarchaeia archaeon]